MSRLKLSFTKWIAAFVLLLLSVTNFSAQGEAAIRFVHVIPDAVPIDVYVNGTLTARNIEFSESTTYITVPAGDHVVTATAAGLQAALWEQAISIGADSATTYIASDAAAPQFDAFTDNITPTEFGITRLAVVHALANGPDVAVSLVEEVDIFGATQDAGTVIVPEVSYGAKFGEFDLPSQNYVVDVVTVGAEDTVLDDISLALASNTSYMAVVYGTATNPRALLLSAPTAPADDTGFVRFVHGIVGGPAVDIFVNDTLIVPAFTPETPTEHIALPEGEHTILFADADTGDALGDLNIEVEAGEAQTIAAFLNDGDIEIDAFEDDISDVDESKAVTSVLNTIDGVSVTVTTADGTELADELDAGDMSDAVTLEPAVSELTFTLSLDGDEATLSAGNTVFYGGTYYNIIVLDGSSFGAPSLLVVPTALARTLASAPGSGEVTLATNTTTETTDNTEATTDDAAEDTETSETTSAETTAATPTPAALPAPTEAPPEVITGEVALDPSANLNLRQFPNADALVLAQAPSGSSLIINGREGAPVALVEGQDPPPEAEDYVDPVTLLEEEGDDLDPSETWVNITYNTPDGGTVIAWTLSQFLIIRDNEGLVPLRDLETVPGNVPGETLNTDVTPPTEQEDIVTVVVANINADANLNLRRTPDASSEVLAQLTLGTVLELNGLLVPTTVTDDDTDADAEATETVAAGTLLNADWAFVSFSPEGGGLITGWVSTNFITYQLNGQSAALADLIEGNFISEAFADTVGEISAGTAPVTAATPDPQQDAYVAEVILNADANLNLRRTPDVDSEVITQIPSGTFLIVSTRTEDAAWLQVTFEGEVGWISSQFVSVTFNGAFIEDITEIPVDETAGN